MCHSFANHPSCQSLDEVGLSGQSSEDFRSPAGGLSQTELQIWTKI